MMPDQDTRHILVLGGGNALGAYQAGAYEALHRRGIEPEWLCGTSIGAIQAGLIAGNPATERLGRLRQLWRLAEQSGSGGRLAADRKVNRMLKHSAALQTFLLGRPGLFNPQPPGFWVTRPGLRNDISLYDSEPMRRVLPQLIDFEHLNHGPARLTVNAVDLASGAELLFDTARQALAVEHLMASSAFLVAYPPVELDGRLLGDGGLATNLLLPPELAEPDGRPTLCLAVDLVPLDGRRPASLDDTLVRAQDLIFASQSRKSIAALAAHWAARPGASEGAAAFTLIHLAYPDTGSEIGAKMFDYSAASIGERWDMGRRDMAAVLEVLARDGAPPTGFRAHRFDAVAGGLVPFADGMLEPAQV